MVKLSVLSPLNVNRRFASCLRCAARSKIYFYRALLRQRGFLHESAGQESPWTKRPADLISAEQQAQFAREPQVWKRSKLSWRQILAEVVTINRKFVTWRRNNYFHLSIILLSRECVYMFYVSKRSKGKKKSELTVAISMTLISKIGNNLCFFLQKQQPKDKKQKPAWMKQFKFKCCSIIHINRIENWSPTISICGIGGKKNKKTTTRCCSFSSISSQLNQQIKTQDCSKCMTFKDSFNASTMLNRYDLTL